MATIGGVLAWVNVFAPLHEVWHWWFALLEGRKPDLYWSAVGMDRGIPNPIIDLSGFFGEVLLEAALAIWFLHKGKFGLSGLFAGMIVSAYFFGIQSTDFHQMPLWGLHTTWKIYVIVVLIIVSVVTMIVLSNYKPITNKKKAGRTRKLDKYSIR